MNARPPHLLARLGPVSITQCPCNPCVHVTVGGVTLHLSPDVLVALAAASHEASLTVAGAHGALTMPPGVEPADA
jgi:hypothetical protein